MVDARPVGGRIAPEAENERRSLLIGDLEKPLMTIEPFDVGLEEVQLTRSLPADTQNLATLQAVIRHVPSLAQGVSAVATRSFTIRMSPEAARGIADGSLKMMEAAGGGVHGTVVNASDGKIVENVTLVSKGVSKVAVAATVFQLLSVVTAQYYLTQINRRLAQVEGGIDDLREHLDANERAILSDSVRHLKRMSLALEGREISEADFRSELVGLDGIDRECGRVLEANKEHLRRYRKELDGVKLSGIVTPDFAAASRISERYERVALTALQAAYVRSIVARFRCVVPSDYRLAYTQDALLELSGDLLAMREGHTEYSARFEERMRTEATASLDFDPLKELLGSEDTIEERRRVAVTVERDRLASVSGLRDELDGVVGDVSEQIDRQVTAGAEPLSLVVTLDAEGGIESLAELRA